MLQGLGERVWQDLYGIVQALNLNTIENATHSSWTCIVSWRSLPDYSRRLHKATKTEKGEELTSSSRGASASAEVLDILSSPAHATWLGALLMLDALAKRCILKDRFLCNDQRSDVCG